MIRRSLLRGLLAIGALATLTPGLSTAGQTSPSTPVLARIVETGTIRIGMSGDQPPFNVVDKTGSLIGFEVELANMLGDTLGVEVEFVKKPFPELLPSLQASEVDIVMSGMSITAARSLEAVFVGPYLTSGKSILTKSRSLASAMTAAELNRDNLKLAALRNSTSQSYVQRYLDKATLTTTENYDDAIQMVLRDEVDALVADMPACAIGALRYPDANLVTLSAPLTVEPIGIAVRANELALQSLLDNYVQAYESSGLLDFLRVQWLEKGDWIDALPEE